MKPWLDAKMGRIKIRELMKKEEKCVE